MKLSDTLLPEFDHEMDGTRRTLERVPDGRFDWRPHEKSTPLGDLATHLANIPTWVNHTFNGEELDIAPPGQPPLRATPATSREDLLATFDRNLAAARAAISEASNEQMMGTWTLLHGGRTVLSMPRVAVLRSFVMNHMIHHRAQLGVYLRLNDIPVPSIYGPSADEGGF
ncbi:MAG TPA: DinB family protein [Pyrinomonadaceae bacterium]|nr:DinB family protein [Pyrinomonadaceae bacterium]